jgi:hypothetical protein
MLLLLFASIPARRSRNFISKLGELAHEARQQRERTKGPVIFEGVKKTICEVERDIEPLELARNEDRATIRELEIGLLKGLLTSLRSSVRGANARVPVV